MTESEREPRDPLRRAHAMAADHYTCDTKSPPGSLDKSPAKLSMVPGGKQDDPTSTESADSAGFPEKPGEQAHWFLERLFCC